MSKYAAEENGDAAKTKEPADPMTLPPEAEFWSHQQKKDYLNDIAAALYKKEQEANKARAKLEAFEAKRVANLVKPDKVEAFDKVYRIQGKKIHRNAVYWCEFSPNSERLATCGHDMCIGVWDVAGNSNPERSVSENQGKRINQVLKGHTGWVMQVRWCTTAKYIASCSADKTIKLWNVEDESNALRWGMIVTTILTEHDRVMSLVWSSDMTRIVSAAKGGAIHFWNVTLQLKKFTGKESADALVRTILPAPKNKSGHFQDVNRLCFNRGDRQLLSCSNDTMLKTWNPRTGRLLKNFEGHHDHVMSCAFSPDGIKIASASHDRTIRIWDTTTGQTLSVLEGHGNIVYDVVFSTYDNGKLLLSAGHDGAVIVWDLRRNLAVQRINGAHKCWILSVDISSSNLLAATSSGDGTSVVFMPMHPSKAQRARTVWHDTKQFLSECAVM
jgi:WD40 repeat protein